MTAIDTDTDLSVIKALDFDDPMACDAYDNCSDQAVWWQIPPCCSSHTPSCDDCRRKFHEYSARQTIALVQHDPCGSLIDPSRVRFEPIKP